MNELEKKYWRRAEIYVGMLRVVPFLRMVAVCNTLAFGKVAEKSDIDLFIVAQKGRLFVARFLVTLILHFMGVRRHGRKISGRFCLSFFVDDSALDLSSLAIDRDIYLAYWVKSMVPLLDDGVYEDFLRQNGWIENYFESDEIFVKPPSIGGVNFVARFLESVLGGSFGNFFEGWMQRWQMRRAFGKVSMAGARADLIVEQHVLKFHNLDRRREYRNLWFKTYGQGAKLNQRRFMSIGEALKKTTPTAK